MEGDRARDGSRTSSRIASRPPPRRRPRRRCARRTGPRRDPGGCRPGVRPQPWLHPRSTGPSSSCAGSPQCQTGDIAVDALDPHAAATRRRGASGSEPDADDGRPPTRRRHGRAGATHARARPPSRRRVDQTAVFVVPGGRRPTATIREIRPDQLEPLDRVRRPAADDRAGARQRHRPPRRPCLAPPRPDRRPAGRARPVRPRQHERLVRQRPAGRAIALGEGDRIRLGRHGARRGDRRRAPAAPADPLRGERDRRLATARRLMDGFLVTVWVVRLLFLGLLYLFLFRIAEGPRRRPARGGPRARRRARPPGRRRVARRRAGGGDARSRSTRSRPSGATSTTRSSSRTSSPRRSTPILTFRGRAWYVEDLGSTNGTFVNGAPVEGVAPLGFGDEVQVGQVRLRLERPRAERSRR